MTKTLQAACLAVILALVRPGERRGDVAHQGSRQYRRRAPEPVDRLRPGRRPQRHRRHAQQHPLHQAVAAGDARAPRRQYPRRRRSAPATSPPSWSPANLPAFGTQGTRIDVTVSALGDAKSLQGGTLLVTPLLGADGNVYAVAQGSLAIGGFQAEGEAAKITRGVPTVGRIANGAIDRARDRIRAQPPGPGAAGAAQPRLHHRQAHRRRDQRLSSAAKTAEPIDPSTVQLTIPAEVDGNVVALPDRDRAVAGRARSRRQDRDRRTLRHHRDGPRRARRPRSRSRRAISP